MPLLPLPLPVAVAAALALLPSLLHSAAPSSKLYACQTAQSKAMGFCDPAKGPTSRVADLLGRMSTNVTRTPALPCSDHPRFHKPQPCLIHRRVSR